VRSDLDRLSDILESATKIQSRVARGRQRFDADEDVQLAVVHLIEILGEACAGVSADTRRSYPRVPWRAAADMRNRVIHGYFDIDLDVVWGAAINEVPALASEVAKVLAEMTTQEGH
jgi:uncharacterized protein with HEPN domain